MVNSRLTGPTDLPAAVRQAISPQMISHRSAEFKAVFQRMLQRLQKFLHTQSTPLLFTCSGTGGMEAALLNTLSPQDHVLVLSAGYYGELFAEIAEKHLGKAQVRLARMPPGERIEPDWVKKILLEEQFDVVLLTHCESSTGILNPIAELVPVIRQYSDALVIVDAISSVGTTPFYMDAWDVDVAITVSQKGLMSPPGLAIILANDRALALSQKKDRLGSFYFDFTRTWQYALESQTPSTPSVICVSALEAALGLIEEEGEEAVFQRHIRLAQQCQKGVLDLGLALFANENTRSPGITAIDLPPSLHSEVLRALLDQRYAVTTATGVGYFRDRILRIGHMGYVCEGQIESALLALGQALKIL